MSFELSSTDRTAKFEAEDQVFLQYFKSLPPGERVRTWLHATDLSKSSTVQRRTLAGQELLLLAQGTDTVKQLTDVVLNESDSSSNRIKAAALLCRMDRFVPSDDFVVRDAIPLEREVGLSVSGDVSPFLVVNGRRIGQPAVNTLHALAMSQNHGAVQTAVKYYCGDFKNEIRGYATRELVGRWSRSVAELKSPYFAYEWSVEGGMSLLLRDEIVERGQAAIPLLTSLLSHATNGAIREEIVLTSELIDRNSVRLRKSEDGRLAIEAIFGALKTGNLKPVFNTAESRKRKQAELYAQFFDDRIAIGNGSNWKLILDSIHQVCGESIPMDLFPTFLKTLTEVDATFPSWEFTSTGTQLDVLHPLFLKKVNRYCAQWKARSVPS